MYMYAYIQMPEIWFVCNLVLQPNSNDLMIETFALKSLSISCLAYFRLHITTRRCIAFNGKNSNELH